MTPTLYNTEYFGPLFYGKKTKELVKWIPLGAFVLLDHEDIDEMAAISLIQKKVKGVLNLASSMSGKYASIGTRRLIQANIPVYDLVTKSKLMDEISQGEIIHISDNRLWVEGRDTALCPLDPYTEQKIEAKILESKKRIAESLGIFTRNTLDYASKELDMILGPISLPPLKTNMKNRYVLVVTRGSGYIDDLQALSSFIKDKQPILMGVDGGADAILECGYKPDVIIGDMDSISEKALLSGAEVIVHAYPNGEAPGLKIVEKLGVASHLFPCFGTSEDAAHLLAYESGALLIVTLGSHTNVVDFFEKGRKGMGSTLLVRLKVGDKLIDAKGISHLFPENAKIRYLSKVRSILGLL